MSDPLDPRTWPKGPSHKKSDEEKIQDVITKLLYGLILLAMATTALWLVALIIIAMRVIF
jgi:hypothetical protein